jgi:hypothetical protein
MGILNKLGEASDLHTNLQKSCVILIRCEQSQLEVVSQMPPYTQAEFPRTYLGLPISEKCLEKLISCLGLTNLGTTYRDGKLLS